MPINHGDRKFRIKQTIRSALLKLKGKQTLHFLHIGKTGGTAVKSALEPHLVADRFFIRLHPHRRILADIPGGDAVIFFLRNPVTRFVSGFYSRQRQGQPRIHSPWSADEKIAFERFKTPNELAIALSGEDRTRREQAEAAMRSIQHVRDSYWSWFGTRDYFLSRLGDIFFIGFQESLSDDVKTLSLKLELPDCIELPNDNVNSHRNPDSVDRNLQDTAMENIKRWYAIDFDFLELCKQKAKEINRIEPGF